MTDRPDSAGPVLSDTWDALQAESMTAETTSVKMNGDTATVGYTYEWHLPKDRVWTYDGELQMGRKDGDWSVRWSRRTFIRASVTSRRCRCGQPRRRERGSTSIRGPTSWCRESSTE